MNNKKSGRPSASKKIYLVNRDFQLRYTLSAVFIGCLSTILAAIVILYPLYVFEILQIPRFLPTPILASMVLAVFINVGFIAGMAVIITHRIAGPMYSLVRYLRQLEHGKYNSYIKLRKGDELGFVVRNYNEMVHSLLRTTRDDLVLVKEAHHLASEIPEGKSKERLREILLELTNEFTDRMSDDTKVAGKKLEDSRDQETNTKED